MIDKPICFSVVIPLYNKSKYIKRSIESVLKQTHPYFELIIVDDGSTDNSASIVNSFLDSRIRFFSQTNGGVSKARNFGAKKALSEWIAFLDADDEYLPDFLKIVSSFIINHESENLSMIGANYYIKTQSNLISIKTVKDGIYDYFELFENMRSPNHSSTTVVSKKILMEVNGFPEGVKEFEDWITWFKLAFSGNFGFISTPLGIYHIVEESATTSKRKANDIFFDAILVPQIIAQNLNKYQLTSASIKNAWGCSNEFIINIARKLAHVGDKMLALKMLKLIRVKYLSTKRIGPLKSLILHLIVPQWMKQVVWNYKKDVFYTI